MSAKKIKIEGLQLEIKTEQSFTFPVGPEQKGRERGPAVVRAQSGKDLQRYCSSDVVS